VNRYVLGDGVRMPRNIRFSGGVDQQLTRLFRAGVTYAHIRGSSLQRGLNLNPIENGARHDDRFINIVQVTSDARSQQDTISVNFDGGLAPPAPPILTSAAPLVDVKRVRFFTNYTAGRGTTRMATSACRRASRSTRSGAMRRRTSAIA
jgi:hypothetical protein